MNFYAIGPTPLLNAICGEDYKYHMCLAQFLYRDGAPTDYFMYYKRRTTVPGYHVILDNGVYEGQKVSNDLLLQATLELNPHVVVLPDVMHQMGATLESSAAFKECLKLKGWKGATMTVVHAEPGNLEQFSHAYLEAARMSPWVGISRGTDDFGRETFKEGGALNGSGRNRRCGFLLWLKDKGLFKSSHHHHALGMREGSLEELCYLTASGLFNSIDSSSPIWRGLHGFSLTNQEWGPPWPDYAFDPYGLGRPLGIQHAKANFEEVLRRCR